jgi:hypothetical protein
LSSAILYLAIIAIWVGVLIPRWLKRDTTQSRASKSSELIEDELSDAGTDLDASETDGHDGDRVATAYRAASPAADRDDIPAYEPDGEKTPMGTHPSAPDARARILTARRRMLMMLVTLTVAALGIAMVRLAAWWVTVPPILMLGGYMMLLREARQADAEHVLLAEAARQDAAAYRAELRQQHAAAQETVQEAVLEAAEPQEKFQTARIIDISERVRDEFYDQYEDAERRAVGD